MKIIATLIKGKDLKAGDLFSTAGQDYWDVVENLRETDPLRIGEKVYIRTDTPCPDGQENEEIYKILIIK